MNGSMNSQEAGRSLCVDAQQFWKSVRPTSAPKGGSSWLAGWRGSKPRPFKANTSAHIHSEIVLAEGLGGGLQERGTIRRRIQHDDDVASLGAGDDVAFEAVFGANAALA